MIRTVSLIAFLTALASPATITAAPLRVLVSSDSVDFSKSYSGALKSGGATVSTAEIPDVSALQAADVVLLERGKFEEMPAKARQALASFAGRGGGVVAVNGAIAAGDPAWGKSVLGGGWDAKQSHKFHSEMMLYVVVDSHPIVKDASPFDVSDDTLYDLDLRDDISVLASAFTPKGRDKRRRKGPAIPNRDVRASIYDLQPQIWTLDDGKHRAAVFLQGAPGTLAHASMMAFVLRAVAWTGKRENVDEFLAPADLADLRYPVGGPRRAKDAIAQFEMQPGFQANVVAAEPLITKPIAIQWDAAGRLWVAETPEYPNGRREMVAPAWKETGSLVPGVYDRPAQDSISWLEDTDGDGTMDKKHLFYQGLELVTGFCPWGRGVIAVAQPSIVYLEDTNGDGSADKVTPLFNGFAPGDTHFVANHFIVAPDGWIYASDGSGADATDPKTGRLMAKISPGVFRLRPDGSAIEQVASQGGNSFGCEVTSDMEIFHGKATSGNPIQFVVLPEWVLARAPTARARSFMSVNPGRTVIRADLPVRAPLMQIDQVGRYSAACSTAVYEGGAWPQEYNGRIFTSEPILDIVHTEEMKPDGPALRGELVFLDKEWLRSKDYWFCPIDTSFGPDGAMYISDFYTPVVAHNDTRGPQHSRSGASVRPDRDHGFGRIYRIQSTAAKSFTIPDLTTADAAGLVAAFRHPNKTVRFNAIRILMDQADTLGKGAVPALAKMAAEEEFAPARILALWALQRMDALPDEIFRAACEAKDSGVRKNAMLIAEAGARQLDGPQAAAGIADADPRVRLATLRALGASPLSKAAAAALLEAKFDDEWSQAAAAAAGSRDPSSQLVKILGQAGDPGQSEESVRSLAASLAESGKPRALFLVLTAAASSPQPALAAAVLDEIGKNPPAAPKNAGPAINALRSLLNSQDRELAMAGIPFAVAWDTDRRLKPEIARIAKEIAAISSDDSQSADRRAIAIRRLVAARASDDAILPAAISLLAKPLPDPAAAALISALAATGDDSAGKALAAAWPDLLPAQQKPALQAIVSRPQWAGHFLDAVAAGKIPADSLDATPASLFTANPDPAVAKRAATVLAGGSALPKDRLVAKLLPEIEKPGDVANGKTMFAAVCAVCHQLEGAGNVFGPALDGIGSHPTLELLTHIVNPNLVVDDEHRTWNFVMKDGSRFSALIASENDSRVQIRLPGGLAKDLKTGDIASREKAPNSLMPEGLEAIGTANLRDVIAYIRSTAPQK